MIKTIKNSEIIKDCKGRNTNYSTILLKHGINVNSKNIKYITFNKARESLLIKYKFNQINDDVLITN